MNECVVSLKDIRVWYERLFDTLGIDYWIVSLDPLEGKGDNPDAGHYTFHISLTCDDSIESLLRKSHIWFRKCDEI